MRCICLAQLTSVIRRVPRVIERQFMLIASYAFIPVSLTISVARLMMHYNILGKAQVVVLMSEGGFGHTIIGPDVARRLFKGRDCVFVALLEHGRHNRKVATIWPDIHVIFLPLNLRIDVSGNNLGLPCPNWFKRLVPQGVLTLIRLVGGLDILFLSLYDLYESIPGYDVFRTQYLAINLRWPNSSACHFPGYFRLQEEVMAAPLRLPGKSRDEIRNRLSRVTARNQSNKGIRLCCLYLRQKGLDSSDITNSRRTGSPLENYLPAVKLLIHSRFQVLLTGDVGLSKKIYQEFGGLLVDGENLGVDKEAFSLFAATEAEIFIGEAGGGCWLPGLNGIPRLILNAFPYFIAMPNSWMYYKTVRDQTGKLVHYSKLFSDHAYDYELAGMSVRSNSAEEILGAVSSFIGDISGGGTEDPNTNIIEKLPDHLWIKHAKNARLSPAWLRLYDDVEDNGAQHREFKAEAR